MWVAGAGTSRISMFAEIEQMPAAEMLEWAAYFNMKAKGTKPEMSPENLLSAAQNITRLARARSPKRG